MRRILTPLTIVMLLASTGPAKADCADIQKDVTRIAIAYNEANKELAEVDAALSQLPAPGDASEKQNEERNQLQAQKANKTLRRDELLQTLGEWGARAEAQCPN